MASVPGGLLKARAGADIVPRTLQLCVRDQARRIHLSGHAFVCLAEGTEDKRSGSDSRVTSVSKRKLSWQAGAGVAESVSHLMLVPVPPHSFGKNTEVRQA